MIVKIDKNGKKHILATVAKQADWLEDDDSKPSFIKNRPNVVGVANLGGQNNPPTLGQSAKNGSATTAARSDHEHALPTINVILASSSANAQTLSATPGNENNIYYIV